MSDIQFSHLFLILYIGFGLLFISFLVKRVLRYKKIFSVLIVLVAPVLCTYAMLLILKNCVYPQSDYTENAEKEFGLLFEFIDDGHLWNVGLMLIFLISPFIPVATFWAIIALFVLFFAIVSWLEKFSSQELHNLFQKIPQAQKRKRKKRKTRRSFTVQ